jgi:hypothetical protein
LFFRKFLRKAKNSTMASDHQGQSLHFGATYYISVVFSFEKTKNPFLSGNGFDASFSVEY